MTAAIVTNFAASFTMLNSWTELFQAELVHLSTADFRVSYFIQI